MSALQKTNRLLQIFLGAFLLIAFRIWHLAVVQREEKLIESQKPKRRTFVQKAQRGAIYDRFGIPLAQSRICYNASIYYCQIAQIPSLGWTVQKGKRKRTYPRREYILKLSQMLAKELDMDQDRIADLIHSKASLFPHLPFTIRSNLTEEQHYRLKGLEREWAGLCSETSSERYYPMGRCASHLLGHLGAISQNEYVTIAKELDLLYQMIADGNEESCITNRYQELRKKAYAINDFVGKTGLEKFYEERLRGFSGKKIVEIDQKGNKLRELENREPIAGESIILSLSAELQEFCESLLIHNEKTRDGRSLGLDPETKKRTAFKQPWIKGGAIAAIDPNTGEVLALASTPRFDPNDFILSSNRQEKIQRLHRWQESETHIASIWEGREPLFREREGSEEEHWLTWDGYLDEILAKNGPLRALWSRIDNLKSAIELQEDFDELLYYANNPKPLDLLNALFADGEQSETSVQIQQALTISEPDSGLAKKRLVRHLEGLSHFGDQLFALDLCRMAVYSPAFTDELIEKIGSIRIADHYRFSQTLRQGEEIVRHRTREQFRKKEFKSWRAACFKEDLFEKRKEEKRRGLYAKPYLDYLDQKEEELFHFLWQKIGPSLLAAYIKEDLSFLSPEALEYFDVSLLGLSFWLPLRAVAEQLDSLLCMQWLKTMRPYRELTRPLLGSYVSLRGKREEQTEKELAAAFYPKNGFSYMRSHAFQSPSPLGSIFKVITGYEALRQKGSSACNFALFDQIHFDATKKMLIVGTGLDRKPFYRHYKGGRLPRSHSLNMGRIDLHAAIEQSSNPFFAILAGDFLKEPNDLAQAAGQFGFGEKTGIDLPSESKGRLPKDLNENRTGLYSFSIGQHTFLSTPLQAAAMLGALSTHGDLLSPKLARFFHSTQPQRDLLSSEDFFAKEELAYLGIDFSLFSSNERRSMKQSRLVENEPSIRRKLAISPWIRSTLFESMDRVVWGDRGSARSGAIKEFYGKPFLLKQYLALKHQMIGKTSTSEVLDRLYSNPSAKACMYKHIWFGALGFEATSSYDKEEIWRHPEIAVVVYLRYGDGGKEAAPLAAQVIHKWRELKRSSTK